MTATLRSGSPRSGCKPSCGSAPSSGRGAAGRARTRRERRGAWSRSPSSISTGRSAARRREAAATSPTRRSGTSRRRAPGRSGWPPSRGSLPQARVAGATLVVAAVAAALPGPGRRAEPGEVVRRRRGPRPSCSARAAAARPSPRCSGGSGSRRTGSSGRRRARPCARSRSGHGLLVDGIVGPQTRAALYARPRSRRTKLIRAWWVVPVQRALGVPADGLYGPVSRAAVARLPEEARARRGRHRRAADARRARDPARGGGSKPAPPSSKPAKRRPPRSVEPRRAGRRRSRSGTSASRTAGAASRRGRASTARGSSCTSSRASASRSRGSSRRSTASGRRSSRARSGPGDIVFFNGLGHDGIYIGGGRFVHSPSSGDVVKVSSIRRLLVPLALGRRPRGSSRPRRVRPLQGENPWSR